MDLKFSKLVFYFSELLYALLSGRFTALAFNSQKRIHLKIELLQILRSQSNTPQILFNKKLAEVQAKWASTVYAYLKTHSQQNSKL